jgi:hypothetical protein
VQTARDAEIVDWIGRIGAASRAHVMARFGMGRSWAYARLGCLVRDGLLEHRQLLYQTPGLYLATAEGLRWRGLERLGVCRPGLGAVAHATELASAAVAFDRALPDRQQLTERELRVTEADGGHPIASASLGDLPGGRHALHRPDLALLGTGGRTVAIEVELSVKAPRRLQAICRGYARARHIDHVYYLATPAAMRAVSRAVDRARAHEQITVLELGDVAALAAAETRAGARRA